MSVISDGYDGEFQSYAPGHGAICFVHIKNGLATNVLVPRDISERLTPRGWKLWYVMGRLEAYMPVVRLGKNVLKMDGRVFEYILISNDEKTDPDSDSCVFSCWEDNGLVPVRNRMWIQSLNYFLTHESMMDTPVACKKIGEA